jgi:vacuolar protein sorting-associated protein VTA1
MAAEAPPNLKAIQPYLKIGLEHDQRDIIVAYWARVYSLQTGIKCAKQPDEKAFLLQIMDWLEKFKKANKDNESISNDTVAQAYLENYANKLFIYADQQDRASNFGKNVVKSFYTSSIIYDIITTFGELSVEAKQQRKYAKWKAAYIHNCLKNGETPHPGPIPNEEDDELINIGGGNAESNNDQPGSSSNFGWNTNPYDNQPAQPSVPPSTSGNVTISEGNDPFLNIRAPTPPKDPEEKHPGGFVPFDPRTSNIPFDQAQPTTAATSPEVMMRAQKLIKYAGSAITYDDVPTAIDNLQKALRLLTTGQE